MGFKDPSNKFILSMIWMHIPYKIGSLGPHNNNKSQPGFWDEMV